MRRQKIPQKTFLAYQKTEAIFLICESLSYPAQGFVGKARILIFSGKVDRNLAVGEQKFGFIVWMQKLSFATVRK